MIGNNFLNLIFASVIFCPNLNISVANDSENGNIMRFMWMTPIQSFNLLSFPSSSFSQSSAAIFLSSLQTATLNYYQEFLHSQTTSIDKDATISDAFYLYQQKGSIQYKKCLEERSSSKDDDDDNWRNCPHYLPSAMQQLIPIIRTLLKNYLQDSMIQESSLFRLFQSPRLFEKSLFIWTSIHRNGSMHAPHHHWKSAISGVVYVKIPTRGVGDIVFYDPRGALPPFGKTLHIVPSEGKIIIFPSWLVHGVEPTTSSDARISISFNIDGEWESTSDVNTAFLTQVV